MLEQTDYRSNPSAAPDPAQDPVAREDPNCSPAVATSPGPDHEMVTYDLPDEPHIYNQMALGIPPAEQGWSADSYPRKRS